MLSQVDQPLSLIHALLGLAVVLALGGIVNTLALSVLERGRESGLLRAVGMTRGEVRAIISCEAVIVALMGAVLGITVGLALGWLTGRAMEGNGLSTMSVPTAQLVVLSDDRASGRARRHRARHGAQPVSTSCAPSPQNE